MNGSLGICSFIRKTANGNYMALLSTPILLRHFP